MASILFTDADGTWKLTNGKPYPADRFSSWTTDSVPVGDTAVALADAAITRFRVRNDYGVTFELRHIPQKRSTNLVVQPEDFGTTWTAVGSPTRSAGAHLVSGITLDLIGDDDAAGNEYYHQNVGFTGDGTKAISGFLRIGTSPSASGSTVIVRDTTAGANRLLATVTFDGNGFPSVAMTTGTYLGYEQQAGVVYRLLMRTTSVTAANTNNLQVGPADHTQNSPTGNVYAGGFQAEDATSPTPYLYTTTAARSGVSMADIADRLRYHLLNGGTCTIYPSDGVTNSWATVGLKPGTEPTLVLADRRAMEFTFSAHLVHKAASPSRLSVYYGG